MNRRGLLAVGALAIAAVVLVCCGLPLFVLNHLRMRDRPELLYGYYEGELDDYVRRLETGEVIYVEGRGYGIPQYLIGHGARYCTKHGDCFCITFGFIADSAVPELWYSLTGFEPMPAELADLNRNGVYEWIPLAPNWAACYR
jgi:hypothetical protein